MCYLEEIHLKHKDRKLKEKGLKKCITNIKLDFREKY